MGARKCITVRIIDDDVADPDEMFRVVVTPLTARVSIQGGSSTTITIINDDGQYLHVIIVSLVLLYSTSSLTTSKTPYG